MTDTFEKIIFVTGGAGFIGSNYLNIFVPQHADILFINIDCLTYAGTTENISVTDAPNYIFKKINICDKRTLVELFEDYHPTGVINFAAESHVDLSIEDPGKFITTNVGGTHNLLALAKEYELKRFHHISTDEVYGSFTTNEGSFIESDALRPRNPYSASKAAADLMVQAYRDTYGLPTVITRSSNVFGPNQDISKLIPNFITKLKNNESVPLYGEGKQIREWTYVEDCVRAIDLVFRNGVDGEVYNIGTGEELSNFELTKKILHCFGKDESSISYVTDRKGHDFRYALNAHKIKTELGWRPTHSFDEGFEKTIAFYAPSTAL